MSIFDLVHTLLEQTILFHAERKSQPALIVKQRNLQKIVRSFCEYEPVFIRMQGKVELT